MIHGPYSSLRSTIFLYRDDDFSLRVMCFVRFLGSFPRTPTCR